MFSPCRAKTRRERPKKLAIEIYDTCHRPLVVGIATIHEDGVCNVGNCLELSTSSDAPARTVLDLPTFDTSDQLTVLVISHRIPETSSARTKLAVSESLSIFLGLKEVYRLLARYSYPDK